MRAIDLGASVVNILPPRLCRCRITGRTRHLVRNLKRRIFAVFIFLDDPPCQVSGGIKFFCCISAFTDIPAGFANAVISIDNQNQIITSSTGDNLYPYFNKKFFRLARGDNRLKITGTGKLKILCSFPVNVGG